jgi:hypothetical protein
VDNFQFRKEDLAELFDLLRKPMETVLDFVARTDLVKVKNQYTVPYETGLLMIIYRLSCPHRVIIGRQMDGHACLYYQTSIMTYFWQQQSVTRVVRQLL